MHDLPRKLSVDELAGLFEGRTHFIERLAGMPNPLDEARALLRRLPEDEQIEALNVHPRIGEKTLSTISAREQGGDKDPAVLAELTRLNRAYGETFGFRFVVFVNQRSKAQILHVLKQRLTRTRAEELETAIDELVAIAEDRHRRRLSATGLE